MLADQSKLKIGQKVHYKSAQGIIENGMIKEIPEHTTTAVRVVYNCNGDWKNFKDYTSALTNLSDLNDGWKFKNADYMDDISMSLEDFYRGDTF